MIYESISEITAYAKVLEYLSDIGFSIALKTFYEEGNLTAEKFEDYHAL
jgi:hypothetical protein